MRAKILKFAPVNRLKMKKLLVILAVIIACTGTQQANAQFRYNAIAGATISNLHFKQDLVTVSGEAGFSLGVQGELMFPGIGFGLDIGLMYNQLGAKVNLGERKVWSNLGYGNERVYLHYVQIPLHLRFKWTRMSGLEEKIAPFVYGGPEFNILVGHNGASAFKCAGADLSLTCGFGFELFQKWQVSGAYSWGMTYALKTKMLDDFSARNRHWSIRLAYFF